MDNNYIQEAKKKMNESKNSAGMTNNAMATGMTNGMTSSASENESALQEARRLNAESRAKKGTLS
ncbi:hypothetical protein GCM10008905_23990 [Clostridium malenominatum]|uniref:Small, acid-soluble spore protein gamma-type n=1 Tax=Clostridium malenominatum TaxID=1539 RepID=A0ABN1J2P3_9CLOT